MVLAELATYLAADGLGLTAGTNLFYSLLPESPDVCVALFEYPGLPDEVELGGTTIRAEWPRVQVVVRGAGDAGSDAPRLLCEQIRRSFTKIREQILSGCAYHAVTAIQAPFPLAPDENFRFKYACNFQVYKDPS